MPCRVYDDNAVPIRLVLYDTSPKSDVSVFLEWFLGEQSGVLMADSSRHAV